MTQRTDTQPRLKSVRLNKGHRIDILRAVMDEWKAQNPEPVCVAETEEALRKKVVQAIKASAFYKRTVTLMQTDPKFLPHCRTRYAVDLYRADDSGNTYVSEFRLAAENFPEFEGILPKDSDADFLLVNASKPVIIFGNKDAIWNERRAAQTTLANWEKERDTLRDEVSDMLEQYNGTNQLREGWPDVVPYLPPHIADPDRAVTLPVRSCDRLSERLGIKQ